MSSGDTVASDVLTSLNDVTTAVSTMASGVAPSGLRKESFSAGLGTVGYVEC